jgi:hypothetical protein
MRIYQYPLAGGPCIWQPFCFFIIRDKELFMPWYNGDYPRSYKNQPVKIRAKAVEIANEMQLHGSDEGVAIATGLKRVREFFDQKKNTTVKKIN